jgi:hypothetical protein
MRSAPESDNCLHMFQSGSKYHIWNPIEDVVWEIMTPMDRVEIVRKVAKLGLKIAGGCGGTSGVFRLIFGLENDWAALDSPLCRSRGRKINVVTIYRGIMARAHFH